VPVDDVRDDAGMTSDVTAIAPTGGAAPDIVWVSGLGVDTCWRLVAAEPVGRVGFVLDGRPVVLPVNHAVDDRTIVFRTDGASSLGRLAVGQPVTFEADAIAADRKTGWSVLISGDVERVDDRSRRRLATHGPDPWAPGDRDDWIRIKPRSVTGRAISRRRRQPSGSFLPYMPPG
jgi:uncharacterized protein